MRGAKFLPVAIVAAAAALARIHTLPVCMNVSAAEGFADLEPFLVAPEGFVLDALEAEMSFAADSAAAPETSLTASTGLVAGAARDLSAGETGLEVGGETCDKDAPCLLAEAAAVGAPTAALFFWISINAAEAMR
jgi:hypothetical protein